MHKKTVTVFVIAVAVLAAGTQSAAAQTQALVEPTPTADNGFVTQIFKVAYADVKDIARGIGLDGRIGSKFLHAGPGYGGSCFPKDTLALVQTANGAGAPIRIVETVVAVNDERKERMVDKIVAACGGSVKNKTVAVLGLTFKPDTDDMRDAPALAILPVLLEKGARVRAHDPEGMEEAKKLLPEGIEYADGPYHAVEGADAVVLMTEWNAYRGLDLERIKSLMSGKIFVDLRNVYEPEHMREAGFDYTCVGRP